MTSTKNTWATFNGSLVRWDVEFSAALWDRWSDLRTFADTVLELGHREEVYIAKGVASPDALFSEVRASARVSTFTARGEVDDLVTDDLGAVLRELRPDLVGTVIPRVSPLMVNGPLSRDRSEPVYISISIETDIWFPWVVGFFYEDGEDGVQLRDNIVLAARHTPRLNRFLVGVRAAAKSLDGVWSHDATFNVHYASMVDDDGIQLTGAVPERISTR
jgi:hypothetical protein